MREVFYTASLTTLIFLLVACTNPTPNLLPTPTSGFTKTSTPTEQTPTNSPQPPPPFQSTAPPASSPQIASPPPEDTSEHKTQYKIDATLNYGLHHLAVDQQIIYTNHYNEQISDLLLIVEPARYPGTFTLKEITWLDGQPVMDYSREIGLIRIPLDEPLQPGAMVGLLVTYELDIPSPSPSYYGRPVPFGYSSRQTNLVDWYPFIPPYQPGLGWVSHTPGPFGEHLVYESADFEVNIRLSDSNPDLVIAASAPGVLDDGWWQYHLDDARNFSWSASDQYVLSTTTVDSVLVMSYYFPFDRQSGEAVLQTTAESLDLFNDLF